MGEVEQALADMNSEISFINGTKRFGKIEIKYENEEVVIGYVLQNIMIDKWWFCLVYKGRK